MSLYRLYIYMSLISGAPSFAWTGHISFCPLTPCGYIFCATESCGYGSGRNFFRFPIHQLKGLWIKLAKAIKRRCGQSNPSARQGSHSATSSVFRMRPLRSFLLFSFTVALMVNLGWAGLVLNAGNTFGSCLNAKNSRSLSRKRLTVCLFYAQHWKLGNEETQAGVASLRQIISCHFPIFSDDFIMAATGCK